MAKKGVEKGSKMEGKSVLRVTFPRCREALPGRRVLLGSEMLFVKWLVSFVGTFSCRSPLAVGNVGPHESVVNSGWVEGCEPSDAKKKGPKEKEKNTPKTSGTTSGSCGTLWVSLWVVFGPGLV